MSKAKIARAKTEVKNIENAFIMFYAKYGDYPKYDGTEPYGFYNYWSDPLDMYLTVGGTPRYLSEFLKMDWGGYDASYLIPNGFYYVYFYDADSDGKIGCGYVQPMDDMWCWYGLKYIFTQDCPDAAGGVYDQPFFTERDWGYCI